MKCNNFNLCIVFLFLFVGIYSNTINAQVHDTIGGKGPVNFDVEYTYKFKIPDTSKVKPKIVNVSIFGKTKKGCIKKENGKCDGKKKPISPYKIQKVYQDTNGYVYFNTPAFHPNRHYSIVLSTTENYDKEQMSRLVTLHTNAKTNNDSINVRNVFDSLYKETALSNPFSNKCNCKDSFTLIDLKNKVFFPNIKFIHKKSINHYDNFLKNIDSFKLSIYYTKLKNAKDSLNTILKDTSKNNICPIQKNVFIDKYNIVKDIINLSQKCVQCKDTFWQFKKFSSLQKDPFITVMNLSYFNDTSYYANYTKLISNGYCVLDSFNILEHYDTTKMNVSKQVQNLYNSISNITNLQQLIDYYALENQKSDFSDLKNSLKNIKNCLDSNYERLYRHNIQLSNANNSVNKYQKIVDSINAKFFVNPFFTNEASTYTVDFITRTGFSVMPDFGFMLLYDQSQVKNSDRNLTNSILVSPYLGLHLNFRPYNTNFAFADINGTLNRLRWWERLSFNTGVLLASLSQAGVRTGLIGSTFVFTGFGYAFSPAVRLTAGNVWYRSYDSNPLIQTTKLSTMPFLGVSIDARIQAIQNAFKGLF